MKDKSYRDYETSRQTANAMSLGLVTAVCLVISIYLGYLFDQYFLTQPVGIFSGIILGLVAGIVQTIKQLREINAHLQRKKQSKGNKND